MSFFYLEGYDKKDESCDPFFTMRDILQIYQPNLIAVPITEKEYNSTYKRIIENPKMKDTIKRIDHFADIQSKEIRDITGKYRHMWKFFTM